MLQKSLTEQLTGYKLRSRNRLFELGLHIRVRNLESIQGKLELSHEKLRHARIQYDLERLNEDVRRLLKRVANGDRLLDIYNAVDLRLENKTPANILEQRIKNIDSIIDLIKDNPSKYVSGSLPITRDVRYSKTTGVIQQGSSSFPVKDDAKKLINYLWGKRKVDFRDKSTSRPGRRLTIHSVVLNCGIIEKKLTNVIDNFNQQMKKDGHRIDAHVRRKDGLIQLETLNEQPASK